MGGFGHKLKKISVSPAFFCRFFCLFAKNKESWNESWNGSWNGSWSEIFNVDIKG